MRVTLEYFFGAAVMSWWTFSASACPPISVISNSSATFLPKSRNTLWLPSGLSDRRGLPRKIWGGSVHLLGPLRLLYAVHWHQYVDDMLCLWTGYQKIREAVLSSLDKIWIREWYGKYNAVAHSKLSHDMLYQSSMSQRSIAFLFFGIFKCLKLRLKQNFIQCQNTKKTIEEFIAKKSGFKMRSENGSASSTAVLNSFT